MLSKATSIGVLTFLAVAPSWADLVIDTNTTSPLLITARYPESAGLVVLPITLGNSNVPFTGIIIGAVQSSIPFAISGDTTLDNVVLSFNGPGCDDKGLSPSASPFTDPLANCVVDLYFIIRDEDPTDTLIRADDTALWRIVVIIPWERVTGEAGPPFTVLNVEVTVFDDHVPEPGTAALALSGAALLAGMSVMRRFRC